MPNATPIYGLPYPADGDTLASAVKATPQALAEGIEAALQTIGGFPVPTAWANVPLGSGWSAGGNGFVYRKHLGVIYVSMHALKASWSPGESIGVLPATYRPSRTLTWSGGGGHSGRVLTNGAITVESASSGGGIPSASFSFPI